METKLRVRMANFVIPLRNGVTFSKYKIYNRFYVIKFISEIAEPTVCIGNTFYAPKTIYIYIVTKNNFTMGILTLWEPNLCNV